MSQILFLKTFYRTCVVLKILQGLFLISNPSWKEMSLSDRSPQTHRALWLQGLFIALQRGKNRVLSLTLSLSSFLPPRRLHIKTISSKKHKTLFKVPFPSSCKPLFFSQLVDFLLIRNSAVEKTKEKHNNDFWNRWKTLCDSMREYILVPHTDVELKILIFQGYYRTKWSGDKELTPLSRTSEWGRINANKGVEKRKKTKISLNKLIFKC